MFIKIVSIMFFFDPLEQFSIELYSSYLLQNIGVLSATSLSKMVLFNFLLVIFCLYSVKDVFICNKFQKLVILLFNFVCINVKNSVVVKKYSFILLIYSIFLFIFLRNLIKIVPYSVTITNYFILTLFFLLAFFISNNIIGLYYDKKRYCVLFLPKSINYTYLLTEYNNFKKTKNIIPFFKIDKSTLFILIYSLNKEEICKILTFYTICFKKTDKVLILRELLFNNITENELFNFIRNHNVGIEVIIDLSEFFYLQQEFRVRDIESIVKHIIYSNKTRVELELAIRDSTLLFKSFVYYRVWKLKFHDMLINIFSSHSHILVLRKPIKGLDLLININNTYEFYDLKFVEINDKLKSLNNIELCSWLYVNQGSDRFYNNNRIFIVLPVIKWDKKKLMNLKNLINFFLRSSLIPHTINYTFNGKDYSVKALILIIKEESL